MAQSYCTHLPSRYAARKLSEMRSRWNGPLGDAVRQLMPRVFPGAPAEVGIGITANSMGATEAITSAGFWEIGWYNIPAGPPDAAPPGGIYRSVAQGGTVLGLIGRAADVSSSWASDTLGQAAVGLVAYADVEARNVIDRIPEDLRPREGGSVWRIACSIMGYVESGGAVTAIRRHAEALRQHDEKTRFHALAREVAREIAAGRNSAAEAYPIVRTMQRLACGKKLAESVGGDVSWWYSPSDEATIEHWIAIAKYGQPERQDCVPAGMAALGGVGSAASSVAELPLASILIPVSVGVVVLGAIGWIAWRRNMLGASRQMLT